jgi:hypothetical protein
LAACAHGCAGNQTATLSHWTSSESKPPAYPQQTYQRVTATSCCSATKEQSKYRAAAGPFGRCIWTPPPIWGPRPFHPPLLPTCKPRFASSLQQPHTACNTHQHTCARIQEQQHQSNMYVPPAAGSMSKTGASWRCGTRADLTHTVATTSTLRESLGQAGQSLDPSALPIT